MECCCGRRKFDGRKFKNIDCLKIIKNENGEKEAVITKKKVRKVMCNLCIEEQNDSVSSDVNSFNAFEEKSENFLSDGTCMNCKGSGTDCYFCGGTGKKL